VSRGRALSPRRPAARPARRPVRCR
jgi:hypothetical protein